MRIHRTRALTAVAAAAALGLLNLAGTAATAATGHATPTGRQAPPVTIYVVDAGGSVIPVNTATNTAGPPINVGSDPAYIAITPNGKTAYALCTFPGFLFPLTATGARGKDISVGNYPEPVAMAITP
jgi:DNA-binding beta-propeller fold protein YncE